ncbi:MAG: enoyl-CoA hydratase [Burkholderiaceae bacterium]
MNAPLPVNLSSDLLLRADADGVATLTLNRPRQYNALSEALLGALQSALDAIAVDPSVRVVVIAAEGTAFCAGHDLKEMQGDPRPERISALFARCGRMMQSLPALPQPVIAKVQGLTTAAGLQLVAQCDLAIASDTARFAASGINLGLFCATPSVPLSRAVLRKHALEMLLTGDFIDASTAAQRGLVNRAVPAHALDAEVARLADTIKAKPREALAMGKALFYRQIEEGLAAAYDDAAAVMACNYLQGDAREGITAFIEKRAPVW